jgi:hypothetical protein
MCVAKLPTEFSENFHSQKAANIFVANLVRPYGETDNLQGLFIKIGPEDFLLIEMSWKELYFQRIVCCVKRRINEFLRFIT